MKEIQNVLLNIIEKDDISSFEIFLKLITNYQIQEDKHKFELLVHLISCISNNHHRSLGFFDKIQQIIFSISDKLKEYYSNSEIFHFFKNNKRVILILIELKIITIDKSIISAMFQNKHYLAKYPEYFYPEIEPFLNDDLIKNINEGKLLQEFINTKNKKKMTKEEFQIFDKKRKIGEDDRRICEIIRRDSVIEFIRFINESDIPLNYLFEYPSIFETNKLLIKYKTSLIEYATFFGSIKIIQYLHLNGVELESSLWNFAVHSNNPHLIHYLEDNIYDDNTLNYSKYMIELIKCHSVSFTDYFLNNLLDVNDTSFHVYCVQYFNFEFFPENLGTNDIFIYLCKYNYIDIVKDLLNEGKIDLNSSMKIVLNSFICY